MSTPEDVEQREARLRKEAERWGLSVTDSLWLLSQLGEAREDAKRIDWLEMNSLASVAHAFRLASWDGESFHWKSQTRTRTLRQAIDAARAPSSRETPDE